MTDTLGRRPHRHVIALLAAVMLALAVSPAESLSTPPERGTGPPHVGCESIHWVRAWGAAPSHASADAFEDMSMRMVFTTLFDGTSIRFELSNRFSKESVTVGGATVSYRDTNAAVFPHGTTRVLFGGAEMVTLRPGEVVLSDRVTFAVQAFRDLALTLHIRGRAPRVDQHKASMQTSYLTPNGAGNHTLDHGGVSFTSKTTSWYLLSGMDVLTSSHVGAVIAFGDSLTDGLQDNASAALDTNSRYPDFLARRLADRQADIAVVNSGISGNRLRHDGPTPEFGPSGLSRLVADAAEVQGARSVILLEGINDIGLPPNATHLDVISALQEAIRTLHRNGLHVYLGTLTPTGGAALPTYGGVQADYFRREVNRWIREQGPHWVEGVIDFDAALRDPANPSRLLPAYDSGDHLHPSTAGYRAMADAVPLDALITHSRTRDACVWPRPPIKTER